MTATGVDPNNYELDTNKSGGGLLQARGCHSLSQLCCILDDYEIAVSDVAMKWNQSFDADISANMTGTAGGAEIEIEYEISDIRPLGAEVTFEFEQATVSINPRLPGDESTVTYDDGHSVRLQHSQYWADQPRQTMYLRWKQSLTFLDGYEDVLVNKIKTGKTVTELITTMYDIGGQNP